MTPRERRDGAGIGGMGSEDKLWQSGARLAPCGADSREPMQERELERPFVE